MTSLERSRESLANDLASTSAQVQSLQEELDTLPVVKNNLQVRMYIPYMRYIWFGILASIAKFKVHQH